MLRTRVFTLLAAVPVNALLPSTRSGCFVPLISVTAPTRAMSAVPAEFEEGAASVGLTDIGGANNGTSEEHRLLSTCPDRSWKSRIDESIGRSRKIRGANFVQLSTVRDGEPRCRTVVFRGFQTLPPDHSLVRECTVERDVASSCVMKMITDNRSNKVSEASQESTAEMVWWFGKTKEQYRIRGMLCFVGGGNFDGDNDEVLSSARKEQWGNLSDPAREQFYWQEPGIPYSGKSIVPAGGRDQDGKLLEPPDTFLLMLFIPRRTDYLRLTDNYRQIDEWKDGAWGACRVNP